MQDAQPALAGQERAVILSVPRVVALGLISTGLFYLFFWTYLTWKQLQSETREDHYPMWHALAMFVPIYGLFRMHAHLQLIQDVSGRFRQDTLNPVAGVLMVLLANVLSGVAWRTNDGAFVLVAVVISTVLDTALFSLAQDGLNKAWRQRPGIVAKEAIFHWGEGVAVVIGIIAWVNTLLWVVTA